MRVALYSPAYRGNLWERNRATYGRDILFAGSAGWVVTDLNDGVINPSSSIEQCRNQAIARADADVLLMIDADVAADGSPLETLYQQLGERVAVGAPVRIRQASRRENTAYGYPAAALMLIDLRKLRCLPKPQDMPWFKRVWNKGHTFCRVDEGVYFAHTVERYGGKVGVADGLTTYHRTEETLTCGGT